MNTAWILPIILLIIALILSALLLLIKNRNKIKERNEAKRAYAEIQSKKEKIETPKDSLESLNKLAKNFFKNYLKLKAELTYPEISEILKQKKESGLADFCNRMDYLLYSGTTLTKQDAIAMANQFIFLTKSKKFKAEF